MSDTESSRLRNQAAEARGLVDEDPLASAREEAITVLSECFARDVLTVEDFERRAELVHGARTVAELGAAIEGIRTGGVAALEGEAGHAPASAPEPASILAQPATPALPTRRTRPYDTAVAIFGESRRQGRWVPARRNTAVAVMGSTVIDFREALLEPEGAVVTAVAFMGGVEVIVPPGIHVECSGSAVFGSFEQHREFSTASPAPNAPVVRVDGFALFGSVEIERRLVGETGRQAKRRRKREKKARRLLQR